MAKNIVQVFEKPEEERETSEYLVTMVDDGSKWENWSEWSECSHTCGHEAEKLKTRKCVDSDGNEIDWQSGFGCRKTWTRKTSWFKEALGSVEDKDCEEHEFLENCPWLSRWTAWTECPVTCGGSTRSRISFKQLISHCSNSEFSKCCEKLLIKKLKKIT